MKKSCIEHVVRAQHARPRVSDKREYKVFLPNAVITNLLIGSTSHVVFVVTWSIVCTGVVRQPTQLLFDGFQHCCAGTLWLTEIYELPLVADEHLRINKSIAAVLDWPAYICFFGLWQMCYGHI